MLPLEGEDEEKPKALFVNGQVMVRCLKFNFYSILFIIDVYPLEILKMPPVYRKEKKLGKKNVFFFVF